MSGADTPSAPSARYRLLEPIARGGMGQIYLAEDQRLGRRVAIKFLREDITQPGFQQRLEQEARHLAQFNHPHIVQVYDLETLDGKPALVMEYIQGRNLRVVQAESRPHMGECLKWLAEIAEGLAYAHSQGIVHSDIKAENVLVDEQGTAKLVDFGIAGETGGAADDLRALGELARELLPDGLELSPVVAHFVQQLRDAPLKKLPSAAEAAQTLRRAVIDAHQAETPLPTEQSGPALADWWRWLFAGATVVAVSVLIWWFATLESERRPVAVLSTDLTAHALPDGAQAEALRSTVQQALQQAVLNSKGLQLVNQREVRQAEQLLNLPLPELARALGAEEVLLTSLNCVRSSCELSLQRTSAVDGAVIDQRDAELLMGMPLESYTIVQNQWSLLYPDEALPPDIHEVVDDSTYASYLDLYQRAHFGDQRYAELIPDTAALLAQAPRFLPLYELYTESVLEAYDNSHDPALINELEQTLNKAGVWAGDSILYRKMRFMLYRDSDRYGEALQEVTAMAQLGADRALVERLRANVASREGDFAAAAEHYDRAVALRDTRSARYSQGTNYYFWGRPDDAETALRAALALAPTDGRSMNLLGLVALEKGNIDEAEAILQQAVAIRPSVQSETNLGLALLFKGDYQGATNIYRSHYERGDRNPMSLLNYADAEQLRGNEETAAVVYREILSGTDGNSDRFSLLARSQAAAQLGEAELAINTLKHIEKTQIGHGESAFNAALVHTLTGQHLSAHVEVKRALAAGLSGLWFTLPWFDPLCQYTEFQQAMTQAGQPERCVTPLP